MLPANHALALDLLCRGFFTLYMWLTSFRISVAVNLVFLSLWIAYVLLGLGMLGGGHSTITQWGAYVTIACAVIAWYTAAASVSNGTAHRLVIPVVPLTR